MKKRTTLLFLLLTICISVQAQIPSLSQIETEPVSVTTGITLKYPSKSLEEDRVVWISVPAGYQESMKKYPVLYMLDAQWSFSSTAQALEWLSNRQYGLIPQMIVVGIHTGGENRARDLAPTKDAQQNLGGGADKLYDFIKEELIPFVDKNYRTYNYRVIGGASLSGLFVAYAFTKDTKLFDGYLCQSPSMWWEQGAMLKAFSDFLSENPDLHNRMYVTMANEGVAMGVDSLAHMLETYPGKQLKWRYDKNPDEVHETIGYKGTWDGIKFLLSDWYYPWYNFGSEERVFSPMNPSEKKHEAIKMSDKVLESYAGMYVDSLKRALIIEKKDKNLMLSTSKLPTLALYPETENTFFVTEKDIRNDLFMEGVDFQFEFVDTDSLVMKVNGQIDCYAKKVNDLKTITLPDEKLNEYEGIYDPMQFGNSFRVLKEGHFLKVLEILSSEGSEERNGEYLYPVGENTFIIFINGTSYDVQYKKEGSIFTFSTGGNTVLEVKKRDGE